jgi:WD40 repeat protein
MAAECPNPERLLGFLNGSASESDSQEVARHLELCAGCERRLEELIGGVADLRQLPATLAPSPSPVFDRMMQQLRNSDPGKLAKDAAVDLPALPGVIHYFGDYEILGELGRGGMGVVYRARQVSLNRVVALKLIAAGQLAAPSEVRRFRTEAEAAARLDHPNIVSIYEVGQHEGRHFFSMKLVEGRPLSNRLPELRAQLSHRQLALLLARIARAVHYAHQRGVLHRDLKPSNILVDESGDPHLTDFGLAKMLADGSDLTHSQAIIGTPNYLSPEMAAGRAKEVTTAADVFSLGAILYEMLAGQPPFAAENVAATLNLVLTGEPRQLRTQNPSVPLDLETISLKCLAREPSHRFDTALELAEDLERFARGEPILSRPVTPVERAWRWARRRPALAILVAALHVVFALGLAGIFVEWRRAEQNADHAEQALIRLELEQADALLQTADDAKGLAQLARVLRRQPDNRVAAERLLSALTLRPIALPVAPLRHDPPLKSWQAASLPGIKTTFPFCFPGSVAAVNFSPDGRYVVTASEDGTARIWDALDGQPVGQPLKHAAEVLWADFSPDGRRIVTASMDHTARVWDAETGAPVSPPLRHTNLVWHASFSPDGQEVISASEDGTAGIWDATTGKMRQAFLYHPKPLRYAAFSPDKCYLVTAERGDSVYVRDRATLKLVRTATQILPRDSGRPFPQFDLTGDQLLTLHRESVRLYDLGNPSLKPVAFWGPILIRATDFLPEGDRLVVAAGNTVRILEAPGQRLAATFLHLSSVLALQASPDGERLLTASADRSARLWDFQRPDRALTTLSHDTPVVAARLSADAGRVVSVPSEDRAWLWQMPTSRAMFVCSNEATVRQAWFSPDGRQVLSAAWPGAALWETASGRRLSGPTDPQLPAFHCFDVHFGPDGPRMVRVANPRGDPRPPALPISKVRIDNAEIPETPGVTLTHDKKVLDARFSPDGRTIVTASSDHTAAVWEAASGKRLFTLAHEAAVNSVAFSSDGNWIATGDNSRSARVWSAATGLPATEWLRHGGRIKLVLFDPTGTRLATAGDNNTIHLWSPQTGAELTPRLMHLDSVPRRQNWCFSPDGTRLATAVAASVQLWDTATGEVAVGPLEMGAPISGLDFSPDGRRIVVAKETGVAALLDAATGLPIGEPLQHDALMTFARFSPDGARVVTGSFDRTLRIWPVPLPPAPVPAWLPELAEAIAGHQLNAKNVLENLPVESLFALRERLRAEPASDYYRRWAHWFLADIATRPSLPPANSE